MKIDLKKKILEIVVENAYTKQSEKTIDAEKEEYNIPPEITHKDILNSAKELEEEGLVTLQKEGKARAQKTWIIPNMEVIASKKDEELKKDLKELAYK